MSKEDEKNGTEISILEEKLVTGFKLPIEFLDSKKEVPENLYEDLELLDMRGISNETIYESIFHPTTLFGEMCIHKWAKYFTTDTIFLRDGQKIYADMKTTHIDKKTVTDAWKSWKEIKDNTSFIDQFQYIGIEKLHWLNKSSIFLAFLSLYSILSPALNLLAPLLLFIVPFIALRIAGIPITASSYVRALSAQLRRHSFGKLFTHWGSVSWSQRFYMLLAFGMYIYNIYQNIMSCRQFYKNTVTINRHFKNITAYLENTKNNLTMFIEKIDPLLSYRRYKKYLQEKLDALSDFYDKLKHIPLAGFHPKKIPFMGYTMKQFYLLYESEEIEDLLLFSFGFNGYLDTLTGMYQKIKDRSIRINQIQTSKETYITNDEFLLPNNANQKNCAKYS